MKYEFFIEGLEIVYLYGTKISLVRAIKNLLMINEIFEFVTSIFMQPLRLSCMYLVDL